MKHALVFQSDFGYVDGAVSAMYGVAYGVDPNLNISNLTHDITPYDIWEASYRLIQTVNYWPAGTVFVSVVDPGVGSARRSIAVKTANGQYIITPDNGTLTHIKRMTGIAEARIIDESINRLQGSSESYTFHGRDVYAFAGAISGMTGVMHASYQRMSNPFDLVGRELNVIAAVVLGGPRVGGGYGNTVGTLLGVLLLTLVENSLVMLKVPTFWQKAVVGVIIIVGTATQIYRYKKSKKA